ncbi:hypothetical protein BRADI_1g73145v3 [Brachypodium distachyon]|uniref:Uncharacterized protein n=1 Tax=Brachypodium distachyon TaxID=15368 RepID=A0A2K2DUX1_BRADI|nr:hypothetical protein BRADI_1g73145v3 [Brachypodium distachyon]
MRSRREAQGRVDSSCRPMQCTSTRHQSSWGRTHCALHPSPMHFFSHWAASAPDSLGETGGLLGVGRQGPRTAAAAERLNHPRVLARAWLRQEPPPVVVEIQFCFAYDKTLSDLPSRPHGICNEL